MKPKVELLSPAGDFEGLIGAINAGADAIYLGGRRFSARAYAGNFDNESLIRALNLAHLFKRNIYLTINTLIKEKEFGDLYDYICPLYEAGLHAVIVQDIGVLRFIRSNFPGLTIHASTQMNVTQTYGAEFLRKNGVKRIIPARELSLAELIDIRKNVDIELETFVHGAMCYTYSGRCLFSSILGGRSGNRGRCAQPCRLPYKNTSESSDISRKCGSYAYPLSLKDMCTIDILPDLIEVGISAFKIEGRMKKPEYTAGVTAVYRKYLDIYYGEKSYQVSEEDRKMLDSLYIRSETSRGYYFQDDKNTLITPDKPSYNETNENLLKSIRGLYIEPKLTMMVNGKICLFPGHEMSLELECDGIKVKSIGVAVEEAKSQPISTESVNKQLKKTGDTVFAFNELVIEMADNCFVSVGELNELRRTGLRLLEDRILESARRENRRPVASEAGFAVVPTLPQKIIRRDDRPRSSANNFRSPVTQPRIHTLVTTTNQWQTITETIIETITETTAETMTETITEPIAKTTTATTTPRIYANIDLWQNPPPTKTGEWYAILPFIIRNISSITWASYERIINNPDCDGVLISNLESFVWLKKISYQKPIILDSSLYIWNNEAKLFWYEQGINEFYLPLELNQHEINEIISEDINPALCVYGRIPMMVTVQSPCPQHQKECKISINEQCKCQSPKESLQSHRRRVYKTIQYITDRMGKQFPVYHTPHNCYNIIYNSVPLSLHDFILSKKLSEISTYRLDFTTETGTEVKQIFTYFNELINGHDMTRPYQDFTTGHIKRGVQ